MSRKQMDDRAQNTAPGEANEQMTLYPVKYVEEYNVVQANELIRSKQGGMTLLEAKLLRLVISQIAEKDSELKTYSCRVSELAKYLDVPKGNIYREVGGLSDSLMSKVITITGNEIDKYGQKPWRKFHWVEDVCYSHGYITIRLSDSIKPYVMGLYELFTRYNYSYILRLPTVYSIRLFELLYSFFDLATRDKYRENHTREPLQENEIGFSLDYLREYFGCAEKYRNNGFIERVIAPAVTAISENTTFRVSYRTVKDGKRITDVVFNLWPDIPISDKVIQRARQGKQKQRKGTAEKKGGEP